MTSFKETAEQNEMKAQERAEFKELLLLILRGVLLFTSLACVATAFYITATSNDYSRATYFLTLALLSSLDINIRA